MDNKNTYKAIVKYFKYSENLKGHLFEVCMLYSLNGKVVDGFKLEEAPAAVLKNPDPDKKSPLPEGVDKNNYYEVWVEDVNAKDPLTCFDIIPTSKFETTCILYNNSWIRKKDNLFVSKNGVVDTCKKLGEFIPFDKDELCMYSEVALGENGNFVSKDGVIRKYKLENLDILNCSYKTKKKNVYVTSKSALGSINREQVEEIDFIDEDALKEWFVKSVIFDREELNETLAKINPEGMTEATFKIRTERCRKLIENFVFSKDDILWFFNRKDLKKEISEHKSNLEQKIEDELEIEKNKKLETLDADVQRIFDDKRKQFEGKLDGIRQELIEKENVLQEKEKQLSYSREALEEVSGELEAQRTALKNISDEIATMNVSKNMIVEALKEEIKNHQLSSSRKEESGDTRINDIVFFERGAKLSEVEDDNYKALFPVDINKEQRKALADILSHKASIIPDVSYAYALAHFMTNTYLNIIAVEHKWYHYDNFVRAGVLEFYNAALADKEHNYLLVLENINIVPIECSFRPLVDLLQGLRPNLPGATELAFPNNLRILATVLPSVADDAFGVKLNHDSYAGFHFVETPKSRLSMPLDRMMNTAQRYYLDLTSVIIDDADGDNGYSNYKDY